MLKNDARLSHIRGWLTRDLGWRIGRITVASADASFRRYFRVSRGDVDPAAWAPKADTLIVMDAPPGKEDIAPYLKVTSLLEQAGAHVPHVHASDVRRGFIVMEDLGDTQYLALLKTGRGVDKLYGDALTTLANIQVRGLPASLALEPYDRAPLERELNLMPEWFLGKHLRLDLSPEERALLTVTFEFLINEALLQPQVFVHRDFHSRNLMVLPGGGPGVIDFQDALRGPIGYDLVSLLKDCYISWSRERVERWVRGYRRVLGNLGANVGDSEYQFMRWFDLIGVQRHVKVLGIFARLWHRDGKIGYLADLPLVLNYVLDACRRYPELVEFGRWLEWRVAPQLAAANERQNARPARRKPVARIKARPKPKPKPKPKRRKPARPKPKPKAKAKVKARVKAKAKLKRVARKSAKKATKRKPVIRRRRTRRSHK
ncbi:MAG TPA: phosphotransferase [Steroidobacteraceae bacterium]|nr:phosphotransferase [Steroidobacteraceae bacterium]